MRSHVFLPDRQSLAIDEIVVDEENGRVEVTVHSTAEKAGCPACGKQSSRIHRWHQRILADLPWQGLSVVLTWRTRKFFLQKWDSHRGGDKSGAAGEPRMDSLIPKMQMAFSFTLPMLFVAALVGAK